MRRTIVVLALLAAWLALPARADCTCGVLCMSDDGQVMFPCRCAVCPDDSKDLDLIENAYDFSERPTHSNADESIANVMLPDSEDLVFTVSDSSSVVAATIFRLEPGCACDLYWKTMRVDCEDGCRMDPETGYPVRDPAFPHGQHFALVEVTK